MSTPNLFSMIEENIKENHITFLRTLEDKFGGIILKVFKSQKNVHSTVYGTSSGEVSNEHTEIYGIVIGDDFFAQDARESGAFKEGILYTTHINEVVPGDLVEFETLDGKVRRYKVMSREGIGYTTEVFTQYRLSAIGD